MSLNKSFTVHKLLIELFTVEEIVISRKLLPVLILCMSGIIYAQDNKSSDDIIIPDGYDMPDNSRTVTVIIPKSVPDATCLADYAKAFDKPDYIPHYSDVIMRSLRFRPNSQEDKYLQRNTFTAMDRFHVTRLEWTYLNSDRDMLKVKKVLESGCGNPVFPPITGFVSAYSESVIGNEPEGF